jgi:hypothetical protein
MWRAINAFPDARGRVPVGITGSREPSGGADAFDPAATVG